MALLCRIRLPWCEADVTLTLPPAADRECLLAALEREVRGAEVFVFVNETMLLPGHVVPERGEALVLPVLSGG